MACFTALDYRNKSYPFVQTIAAAAGIDPISYGCYDSATDAAKLYQFYVGLATIGELTPVTQNCFVQKTEDQQYFLTNEALAAALPPVG
jgi:hypothetical protein